MEIQPFLQEGLSTTHRPIVNITTTTQAIRDAHSKDIPSKEERKELLGNLPVECSNPACSKIMPRDAVKACSRCKQVRYCGQACQKQHWRSGHKDNCGEGTAQEIALKLAERTLAVPKITDYYQLHCILTLKLLEDRSNAEKFVVNIGCATGPADIQAYLKNLMSGNRTRDKNAQVSLIVKSFKQVAFQDAPVKIKRQAEGARELVKTGYWSDGMPSGGDSIVVAIYFTSVEEKGNNEWVTTAGGDGAVSAVFLLPESAMTAMANDPKCIVQSAMLGSTEAKVDASLLRDGINNMINMDKDNKMRLRAWPNKA